MSDEKVVPIPTSMEDGSASMADHSPSMEKEVRSMGLESTCELETSTIVDQPTDQSATTTAATAAATTNKVWKSSLLGLDTVNLQPGDTIRERWKIDAMVGKDGYDHTFYRATDVVTQKQVIIKIKPPNKDDEFNPNPHTLKLETVALKRLQQCPGVVRYLHSGIDERGFLFIVMEHYVVGYGPSEDAEGTKCSIETTAKLGLQMLDILRDIHNCGFIHRNVSPYSFVTVPSVGKVGQPEVGQPSQIVLSDFAMARKFTEKDGKLRPPRIYAGFRGSIRYASPTAHMGDEQTRRDDLWSLFYVLVEMATGSLPWSVVANREEIGRQKCNLSLMMDHLKQLPNQFTLYLQHLRELITYESVPDYDMLHGLLESLINSPEEKPQPTKPVQPPGEDYHSCQPPLVIHDTVVPSVNADVEAWVAKKEGDSKSVM